MPNTLCFLCCENFHAEVAAAIAQEGWLDVTSATLPARCGRPPLAWEELRAALPADGSQVEIIGKACLIGLEQPPTDFPPVQLVRLEQCFHLLTSSSLVAELIEQGAYLLTPGWLACWRGHIAEMGFDIDNAAGFFQDFARELVLLDTGVSPDAQTLLAEMAEAVGLPARRIGVGLDHLRLLLGKRVVEWRLQRQALESRSKESLNAREIADHRLAMELLAQLSTTVKEAEIIAAIESFFQMLFAPAELHYVPMKNGLPDTASPVPPICLAELLKLDRAYAWTPSGTGFALRIEHDNQVLGLVWIERLAFPAYRERYLNLALAMVGVCGLAIDNARNRKKLVEAEKMASLSFLVAGVAHGINTPLGICLTAASSLQRNTQHLSQQFAERNMTQSDLTGYLDNAQSSTRLLDNNLVRISHLIETFRQVAVFGKSVPKSHFRLKAILDDVIRSLSARIPHDRVKINVCCDEQLEIDSVADDWNTIFVNLIANSLRHGFKEREQGTIDLHIQADHDRLQLDYRDDGNGIAADVLSRMFDPFFTTDLQQGMGLGMHLVYNLITHRLRGSIDCESQPGHGVHFQIRIPLQ